MSLKKYFSFFVLFVSLLSFAAPAFAGPGCKGTLNDFLTAVPKSTTPKLDFICKNQGVHYFSVSGLKSGEIASPQSILFLDPTQARIALKISSTLKANADGNAVFSADFVGSERIGSWLVGLKGSLGTLAKTKFSYKAEKPRLFFAQKK